MAQVSVLTVVTPTVTTNEGVALTGNVLTGAADGEGDSLTATVVTSAATAHGSVTIAADGSYTYTPNAGYFGSDSFTFTANSSDESTDGTVTVNISQANDRTGGSPSVDTNQGRA